MIFRTLILLLRRPELLLGHAGAYGGLMAAEMTQFKSGLLRKLLWSVVAAAAAIVALSVGGVALILGLSGAFAAHWSMWGVPLGLLLIAGIALLVAMRPMPNHFEQTRAQFKEDVAWLCHRDEPSRGHSRPER